MYESVFPLKSQKLGDFVREAIWQVESEFARDSRQALIDFSKLVVGSASNKLFVGPQLKDWRYYLEVLMPAARECSGNVYVTLVPHPQSWLDKTAEDIQLWKLVKGEWLLLGR
ncbi:hypothetical protein ACFLXE_03490 [Chloroflexota bacterium]